MCGAKSSGWSKSLPRNAAVRRLDTGRVCALCGKTRSPSGQTDTYGFKTLLIRAGLYPEKTGGREKCHRECVASLGKR